MSLVKTKIPILVFRPTGNIQLTASACNASTRFPVLGASSEHRRRLNIFGWVAPLLGRHAMMRMSKGHTPAFLAVLRHLRKRMPGNVIHLFVDRATWHKGPLVEGYLGGWPALKFRNYFLFHL